MEREFVMAATSPEDRPHNDEHKYDDDHNDYHEDDDDDRFKCEIIGANDNDGDDDAERGNLILLDPIDTQPSGRHTSILSPNSPQGNVCVCVCVCNRNTRKRQNTNVKYKHRYECQL